ncbi:MAG: YggS family pyridoxal phosphate-dependent enzyme [Blastochloris sp.]|nr:YggS family pyridoxal phosphate-dependent enzyme [Blastochloris sp.]
MNESLAERLSLLQQRITAAAIRAGRRPSEVKLLPASKKVSVEVLRELFALGVHAFGENKVQEAKLKVSMLPASCSWHFIGGLQRNKAKDAVRLFQVIHSLDSRELIDELAKRATEAGKTMQVLIEVNAAGEASKHGARPEEASALVEYANQQRPLEVIGLMAVVPFYDDVEKVRPYFKQIRELRDSIQHETGIILPELSMGMSHDFEVAIEEGATWVRVGTSLFGER